MIRKDLILVVLLVLILALMVVPLNQAIIDVLVATNMSLSILLLMVAIYLRHPSDFSTFPAVILLGTAFRLALSIATTRLILAEADAGQIIETFGAFVVSGSIVIGMVIFLIITVVQFLVITKGAERVAEVSARFALDAMPGKQMSIDSDVRAGTIDQESGASQRRRLDKDSQFFGAMDGAMKFVKGDAIAGIIIVFINLLGGIAVGASLHGYSASEAVSVYSLLTVGDGLVAQIPALLMSLSAGVVVTRVAGPDNSDLGSDIIGELVADPKVPALAALVVACLGLIPGFPFLIFATAAATLFLIAFVLRRTFTAAEAEAERKKETGPDRQDRLVLVLGGERAKDLDADRLQAKIDAAFARDNRRLGVDYRPPTVRVDTDAEGIEVILDEVPVHEALTSLPNTGDIEDHLVAELVAVHHRNLDLFFTSTVFEELWERARQADPTGVSEIEGSCPRGSIHRTLSYLAEEAVPLRPLGLLTHALLQALRQVNAADQAALAEALRQSLSRQICNDLAPSGQPLNVAMIDPEARASNDSADLPIGPADLGALKNLSSHADPEQRAGAVLTKPDLRRRLRETLAMNNVYLPVLSLTEISPEIETNVVALIPWNRPAERA